MKIKNFIKRRVFKKIECKNKSSVKIIKKTF